MSAPAPAQPKKFSFLAAIRNYISQYLVDIRNVITYYLLEIRSDISYYWDMKKYFFTTQISKKLRSINDLPEWLASYPDFKDQIKLIRETLGMTQEQLGKLVNRSLRSIQLIESGRARPRITTLYEIANALNAELKIALIPRQYMTEFLNEKASKKARQLVSLSKTSSALEIQAPSDEESNEQIEALKRDILEKRRDRLWDQSKK